MQADYQNKCSRLHLHLLQRYFFNIVLERAHTPHERGEEGLSVTVSPDLGKNSP